MMNKNKRISTDGNLSEMDESILYHRLKIALDERQIANMEGMMSRHFDGNSITLSKIIRITAICIVIISVSALPFYLSNTGKKGIFNDYFTPYSHENLSGIYRGQESGKNAPFLLYSVGNFSKALPKLRLYVNNNPADLQARLLLANCLIEERQFNEAEAELTEILDTGDYYFREDALWYLALLAVRRGDLEKARKLLEPIKNDKIYGPLVQSLRKVITPQSPQ